ncbi:hypothetical protein E2C01_095601 [Portunus trituberculatus]|jgi:hypothetical protein
MITGV